MTAARLRERHNELGERRRRTGLPTLLSLSLSLSLYVRTRIRASYLYTVLYYTQRAGIHIYIMYIYRPTFRNCALNGICNALAREREMMRRRV